MQRRRSLPLIRHSFWTLLMPLIWSVRIYIRRPVNQYEMNRNRLVESTHADEIKIMFRIKSFRKKNWFFGGGNCCWYCLRHYSFSLLLRSALRLYGNLCCEIPTCHIIGDHMCECALVCSPSRVYRVFVARFCILWKWRIVNAKPKPNKCHIGNVFSTDIYSSVRIGDDDDGIHATLIRARIANALLSPGQWQSSEKYQIEKFFLHS